MLRFFVFFFYFMPQPAEYGAEDFSRRCPDAGVGKDRFGRKGAGM